MKLSLQYFFTEKIKLILFFTLLPITLLANPDIKIIQIGQNVTDSGSVMTDDSIILKGKSSGVDDSIDNCIFAKGKINGDFDFSTKVTIIDTGESEAGLMLREDTLPGARCIELVISKRTGILLRYRLQSGKQSITIPVSSLWHPYIRIQRRDDLFTLGWKDYSDSTWRSVSTTYRFEFKSAMFAGFFQTSNSMEKTSHAIFTEYFGLSDPTVFCHPKLWDFERTVIDSVGLDQHNFFTLASGALKSTTPGGSSEATISTEEFSALRTDSLVAFQWQVYSDRDTAPELGLYGLFARDSMALKDRVSIINTSVGCNGNIFIGNDSRTGSVFSGGNVVVNDRTVISGDIITKGGVTLGSQVMVTGRINQRADISFPNIPLKTVSPGTGELTLYAGDSMNVTPGSYKSIRAYGDSKVRFGPGIYQFGTIMIEPGVKVYVVPTRDDVVDINVRDTLRLGDRMQMILTDTTLWRNISIFTSQTSNVFIGNDLLIRGCIYAPNAEIQMYTRILSLTGGIYGKRIIVEPDSRVTYCPAGQENDVLTTTLKNANGDKDYSLIFKINRTVPSGFKDILFLYGNDTITAFSTDKLTSVKTWITFRCEFYKASSFGGNGRVRLLYDEGYGYSVIKDTVQDSITVFNDLSFRYATGVGNRNKQIGIDNILISCISQCSPIIVTRRPQNIEIYEGEDASFAVGISDSKWCSYEWYRNDALIANETDSVLRLRHVSISDSGLIIKCRVISECDTTFVNPTLLQVYTCSPPIILSEMNSLTKEAGGNDSLTIVASGLGLQYQWFKNFGVIPGAESNIIKINNLQMKNDGDIYSVKITNSCGKWTMSDTAVIHMAEHAVCSITVGPKNDTLEIGDYYSTEVKSRCNYLKYLWYRNGVAVDSTISGHFTYGPVTINDNDMQIKCVVTNGVQYDTSETAIIKVIYPKEGNRLLTISGELKDGSGKLVGLDTIETKEFMVKLYSSQYNGAEIYCEKFTGKKRVAVDSGHYNLILGKGYSNSNLQKVMSSHSNVHAEIYAGDNSQFELLGPRISLTTVPYSFSSGVKVVYGNGSPIVNNMQAPTGTMYVDKTDNNSTWKKLQSNWKKLD